MRYIQTVTQNLQKKKVTGIEGKSLSLKRQNNLSDLNKNDIKLQHQEHKQEQKKSQSS